MDSTSSKKPLRNDCSIDRISDLPDSILGQILSYLPIEDIIATSILSTRWKSIFPSSVPLIKLVDFDDSYKLYRGRHRNNNSRSSSRNFVEFVDKLLNVTLRDARCVEKVVLSFDMVSDDDKIISWVCAALRLNVKHLRLMSILKDSENLLYSLNGCKTLVELELMNSFILYIPKEFILPNLKKLSLYVLVLGDSMLSIDGLLDGCPVLNDLRITGCDFGVPDTLYIRNPILKRLFIGGYFNETSGRIVIDAPKLEAFVYEGELAAVYVMNTRSLRMASIDFDYHGEETDGDVFRHKTYCLVELVKACSSTMGLFLSGKSMMALYSSLLPLPTFQNLTCLALGRMGSCGWKVLDHFLINAPNLTILSFEEGLEFSRASYVGFKSYLTNLPVYLELRVKKIEIWKFKWTPDEITLMKNLLVNGRVLQELIVHCLPCENKSDLEKLSMLPRCSETCQIIFKYKKDLSPHSREKWF